MSKFETPQWLREELARHLGGAQAPEGLWDRIQTGRQAANLPHPHWTRWAVAAILALTTAVATYWLPGPQLRADVLLLPSNAASDSRRDHPAQWDLRCAPPASRSGFRVANLSAQRGHSFALAVSGPDEEAMGCQACHSIGANQHHL